jgi:hypothetical protein
MLWRLFRTVISPRTPKIGANRGSFRKESVRPTRLLSGELYGEFKRDVGNEVSYKGS